jgi:hypothetical protein
MMNTLLETLKANSPLVGLKKLHPTLNAIVVIFAIIMLWRGVWGLIDLYLFPDSPTFSHLLSLLLGALVLYLDDFSLKDLKR